MGEGGARQERGLRHSAGTEDDDEMERGHLQWQESVQA